MAECTLPADEVDPQADVIYTFSPDMEPRWSVEPGTALTVKTIDSLIGEVQSEDDLLHEVPEEVNAATGPIAVEGAQAGDVLAVELHDVRVAEDIGRVTVLGGFGLHHEHDAVDAPRTRIVDIEGGRASFGDIDLEVTPMIGTIGVAPQSDSYTTLVPHDHGGNLDTTDIAAGTTLYLPVSKAGGLLALGDSKAVMGDGEVSGTGAEVATEVDLTVDVIRDPAVDLERPLLRTPTQWKTVASAETLERACELANEDLIGLLQREHSLDFTDAYMLSSLAADLEISQVVDPLVTVRNAIDVGHLDNPFS